VQSNGPGLPRLPQTWAFPLQVGGVSADRSQSTERIQEPVDIFSYGRWRLKCAPAAPPLHRHAEPGDIFVLYFDGAVKLGSIYPLSGSRTTKKRIGMGLLSGVMRGNPRPGISFHSLSVRVMTCVRMFY
jgi:hypothetical protein